MLKLKLFFSPHSSDPWDYDTLYGWISEYAFQMISGDLYLIISMLFASFFISVCLYHRAFSEQLEATLNQLNELSIKATAAQVHDEERNKQLNFMRRKRIYALLHRIVQFHVLLTE